MMGSTIDIKKKWNVDRVEIDEYTHTWRNFSSTSFPGLCPVSAACSIGGGEEGVEPGNEATFPFIATKHYTLSHAQTPPMKSSRGRRGSGNELRVEVLWRLKVCLGCSLGKMVV